MNLSSTPVDRETRKPSPALSALSGGKRNALSETAPGGASADMEMVPPVKETVTEISEKTSRRSRLRNSPGNGASSGGFTINDRHEFQSPSPGVRSGGGEPDGKPEGATPSSGPSSGSSSAAGADISGLDISGLDVGPEPASGPATFHPATSGTVDGKPDGKRVLTSDQSPPQSSPGARTASTSVPFPDTNRQVVSPSISLPLPELSMERADELTRPLFQSSSLRQTDYADMARTFQKNRIRTAVMDFLWQRLRDRWWHRPPVERCHIWETMKTLALQEISASAGGKRLLHHIFTILTDPWEENLALLTLFAKDTLRMEWDADARQHLWVGWSVRFTQLPCRGRTIAIRVLRELDRRFFPGALAAEMIDFYKTLVLTFPAIWWREVTSYDPHLEDNLVTIMGSYMSEKRWDTCHIGGLQMVWLSCLRFARPEEQRIAEDVLRLIEEKAAGGVKPGPLPVRPGEHLRVPIPQDVILMSVYRQRF